MSDAASVKTSGATAPAAPALASDDDPRPALEARIARAAAALRARQRPDGHWIFELEADATIPAEYVLLRHFLGEAVDAALEARIATYLRRRQAPHGGWPLHHGGGFDISASVKAYYALKMIGDPPEAPHMAAARTAILAHGGAAAANVFTRIQLALFGQTPWREVPAMPAELILLPRWFPIHLSKMSYWARTVIAPLLVLQALRPLARNPRGVDVAELYAARPSRARASARGSGGRAWRWGFAALDVALKAVEPAWPRRLRARAVDRCVAFVTARLNGEDGLGAIYPAIANSVMMYAALGYPPEHPHRSAARAAIERLLVIHGDEAYCQPCVSPVWDTALATHALLEAGTTEDRPAAARALDWLTDRQVLDVRGDWAQARPDLPPGGWAFQYSNPHYPDLDDTAVVVMALDRAKRGGLAVDDAAIARGAAWVRGMQSWDGGWAAFDIDNTFHYLNNIPFADHGALLDPPTEDVTARCASLLAQLGEPPGDGALAAALRRLEASQRADGSWFGRWGVNHVYGTWSALCAFNAAGIPATHPAVRRGADWLVSIQNADGGWGEGCDSYDLDRRIHRPAPSAPSQTAWALLGLMAAGRTDQPAVRQGIDYLLALEDEEHFWPEPGHTGGGFPRVFYLRYHGYAKVFPLWALARYRNLIASNSRRPEGGM